MAGIEITTGELFKDMVYKCTKCGKILDEYKDMVRPWWDNKKHSIDLCHPVTYYSNFLEDEDTYLCGPVVEIFRETI